MLVIGELINSTRKPVQEAIKARNAAFILKLARAQLAAGADFLDINCAVTTGNEIQDVDWVISVIQSESKDANICVDSPSHLAIEKALEVYKGKGSVMINSVTLDEKRLSNILPLALKYKTKLIALTMSEKGMPNTASERAEMAKAILDKVKARGFNPQDLYFDPLIRPIATEPSQAREFLESVPLIKRLGAVKTVCGLSNVSFGLPKRHLINSLFLSMAIERGLDGVILDPLDKYISSSLSASMALLGLDEYCANYLKAFREGRLL